MSEHSSSSFRRGTRLFSLTAAAAGLLLVSGCTGGTSAAVNDEYGFATAEQVEGDPITVWVDASREPAVTAFKAAHPDIPIEYETYDGNAGGSGSFQTKIALLDQSGEGWPDVVFSTQQNDATWAARENNGVQAFAAPLNEGYLDQDFLDGFAPGALDPVTVDGTVYGLRNDLAQVVTYYNQKLLTEFGYDVPETWEDYEALGVKLAAEHPGYILGSVGDSWMPYVYYWGAQAPIFQTDGDTFSSDTASDESVEISRILDTLIDNGTLVQDSYFSSTFAETYADKVVALPGPVWYTGAIFQTALQVPAGEIGVGAPLHWEGEEVATGNVGGGIWYASSHSENLDAVETFLEFVTSSDEFQVELSSGYPAYSSAAEGWLAKQADANYFLDGFDEEMISAGASVWDAWGYARFSPETGWATVIVPGLAAGTSIEEMLPAWQEAITNDATVNGYTVK